MRPVSASFPINQPFGSMATAGVAPSSTPGTVGWYVQKYGNYQPYGHAGCDIACPEGTPVYAIAAGTVLWADWGTNLPGDETNGGYRQRWYLYKGFPGIVTVIQHDGWVGVYAHLSRASMNRGDKVTEGQQIGLSGGTGGVAPHLHVEALIDLSYKTGGGLIYGRTSPEPFFGAAAIAPQGDIITAPQEEDDMALFADRDAFKAAVVEAVYGARYDTRDETNKVTGTITLKDLLTYYSANVALDRRQVRDGLAESVKTIVEGVKAGQSVDPDKIADQIALKLEGLTFEVARKEA